MKEEKTNIATETKTTDSDSLSDVEARVMLRPLLYKIHNEDCKITLAKLPSKSVDMVLTSPPYNRERNDKYEHYDDRIENYFEFLKQIIDELLRVTKGNVFFNIMANYYNRADVYKIIGEYNNNISNIFIWEKSNPLPAQGINITNAYEFILAFGELRSNNTYTKNHITTSVAQMEKEHKAIMHEDVANYFISNFSNEGEIIYDPFNGTGTTCRVADRLERAWFGSEIVGEYCSIALRKIENDLFTKATT